MQNSYVISKSDYQLYVLLTNCIKKSERGTDFNLIICSQMQIDTHILWFQNTLSCYITCQLFTAEIKTQADSINCNFFVNLIYYCRYSMHTFYICTHNQQLLVKICHHLLFWPVPSSQPFPHPALPLNTSLPFPPPGNKQHSCCTKKGQ